MKPGYNTNGLAHHRLEEALELLAETGFRAVALTPDTVHLDPMRIAAAEVARTAALLQRLGLEPVVETGGRYLLDPHLKHRPNLLEREPGERGRRLDLLERIFVLARDLGAGVVSLWSGHLPAGVAAEEAWPRLLEGLARLGTSARARGLRLALEPEPGHLVEKVREWRRLRAELGSEGPGLCLDVGHLVALDEGWPSQVLEAGEAGALLQVHLEDARSGRHEHLEPGEGEVDFAALARDLAGLGYGGPVCWELSRSSHRAPEAVARAWACWRRCFEPSGSNRGAAR